MFAPQPRPLNFYFSRKRPLQGVPQVLQGTHRTYRTKQKSTPHWKKNVLCRARKKRPPVRTPKKPGGIQFSTPVPRLRAGPAKNGPHTGEIQSASEFPEIRRKSWNSAFSATPAAVTRAPEVRNRDLRARWTPHVVISLRAPTCCDLRTAPGERAGKPAKNTPIFTHLNFSRC